MPIKPIRIINSRFEKIGILTNELIINDKTKITIPRDFPRSFSSNNNNYVAQVHLNIISFDFLHVNLNSENY